MVKYQWPQVMSMGYQNGVGTKELYEVGANKVFRMSSSWLSARLSADAGCEASMVIRTAVNGAWKYVVYLRFDKAGQLAIPQQFHPAVKIPAGYDIAIVSDNADLDLRGGFFGQLEDV